MGIKEKDIKINPQVIDQIKKDLDSDGVRIYEFNKVPAIFVDNNLIHPAIIEKCSCITAATSACYDDGRNYMILAASRVDKSNGEIVTDIDPIVMVADLETGSPAPSGCIRFHGHFKGRTESENLNIDTIDIAVLDLRKKITGSKQSFQGAPPRITEAMHYMANVYRRRLK